MKIGQTAVVLLLVPVMLAWSGYAVSATWAWFVVPLGLPAITWAHGAGISLLWTILTPMRVGDKEISTPDLFYRAAGKALFLGFLLLIGWGLSWLM